MAKKVTDGIVAMEDKQIMFAAMHTRGITQVQLAEKLGIKQSSLSGNMNRTRMGLDVFVKTMNALGYDVIVADQSTGEKNWKVKI